MADSFDTYTSPSQLTSSGRWDEAYHGQYLRIATEAGNSFYGGKSLEMTLPIGTVEISNAVHKQNLSYDKLFIRIYAKFDPGYSVNTSNHNGVALSANYPGPGIIPPPDGTGFFLFLLQNNIQGNGWPGEVMPGFYHLYSYWPRQRSQWGDHWYQDGTVVPYSNEIGNQGEWLAYPARYPDFHPYPNTTPQRGRWYCYELMVKANTPGLNNGEVKFWIDGVVAGDFPDLFLRSITSLKLDKAGFSLHALHSERVNKKWYDQVVVAKSYIGPLVLP